MSIVMSRTWVTVAAAVAVAGLAASACGTNQLGAAAVTTNSRVSSSQLTNQVANLNAAYAADRAKGVKPQRTTGQEAQQVLTWLLTFKVYNKIAEQRNIHPTPAQADKQLAGLATQAKSSKVTLDEYVSAAGALPPDLVPQLGQYFAILASLEYQLNGNKTPTSSTSQTKLESRVSHAQCLASRDLQVQVNPQFGVWDYRTYSVALATPKLAANPSPSAAATPAITKAPC